MERIGEIFIYQTADGQTSIDVTLEKETVWLSQEQMAELFSKSKSTINEHIKSIYKEGELFESDTKRKFGNSEFSDKPTSYYSLDVIISVGYRVKSQRGIQFRIWANQVLKNYLTKGYAIDKKRLQDQSRQLEELKQTVKLLENVVGNHELTSDESSGLLKVVIDYTYALDVLDQYDHQVLEIQNTTSAELFKITYQEAVLAIKGLRDKFGGSTLFGNEKDESFQGSLAAIYQTFDGHYVYPSVEEKAANLLYFVIKNHSFSDGNKRIAAFLFVWFLEKNRILYRSNGSKRIADNALVAITLMIAESKPEEKEMMVKVVVSLINLKN
ncbi:cytochrome C biogenesis protein CycH [Niastella vici]|uniref:Cytochrome C biogenesis protein CycH n=1 Tax=Niastella vici TaxID=1703345 RepID=A0A1V9FSE2_9BACT|nr:virulence protein RhuM/Fic/DOC family protein [Niastella vici]OQP61221.1 cytochrome C biogenesis protein CycH [Niastella vici]